MKVSHKCSFQNNKYLMDFGGGGRNRTADTGILSSFVVIFRHLPVLSFKTLVFSSISVQRTIALKTLQSLLNHHLWIKSRGLYFSFTYASLSAISLICSIGKSLSIGFMLSLHLLIFAVFPLSLYQRNEALPYLPIF